MKAILFALASLASCAAPQPATTPTADAIMARVAANQDTAEAERLHYVYIQHTRVTSHKGTKVMCEETTDSRVTPDEKGSHQQLLTLNGRLFQKGQYITYADLPKSKGASDISADHDVSISIGGDDSDRDLVENMRDNFTNDKSHSKDGIDADLFPLTTKSLREETFTLLGRERMGNRDVFHIAFAPKDKSDFGWKGEAYIDTTAFEPVMVRTALSRNIPFAVRTLLGTNVPGLGFSVTYAPQPDGTWFPTSFGTEFRIKVLFLYSRKITIFAENRDFEKTHVASHIVAEAPAPQ